MNNTNKKTEFHGSDLEKIEEYYHIPKDEIVSFGANVNPLGLSDAVKDNLSANLDIISTYPDRNYKTLKNAISNYTGASTEYIVVGNGSTELISLLISQRKPSRALLLGPTYSEYARELSLVGGAMSYYNLKEETHFKLDIEEFLTAITDDTELVILCNPNNPTSSALTCKELEEIIYECEKRDIFVMIDETYVEFAPSMASITAIPLVERYDNFMIIRGVSKFFAAPGLRFGYGITSNKEFLASLLEHQNPWSLNSIGAYAGELLLSDQNYIQRTRDLICTERDHMIHTLSQMGGVKVYDAFANFILIKIIKEGITSFDVFEACIREKMMIRDCSSFESLNGEYVRFCIMNPDDNKKLMECLRKVLS